MLDKEKIDVYMVYHPTKSSPRDFCPVCQDADVEVLGEVDGDSNRIRIRCLDPACGAVCIETYEDKLVDIEQEAEPDRVAFNCGYPEGDECPACGELRSACTCKS